MELLEEVAPLPALAVAVKPSSTVLRAISRPERREPNLGISHQVRFKNRSSKRKGSIELLANPPIGTDEYFSLTLNGIRILKIGFSQ